MQQFHFCYLPKKLKSVSQRDIFTPMFIVVLFLVAKTQIKSRCPLTDEWIKKENMAYTYNRIKSVFKKREILPYGAT